MVPLLLIRTSLSLSASLSLETLTGLLLASCFAHETELVLHSAIRASLNLTFYNPLPCWRACWFRLWWAQSLAKAAHSFLLCSVRSLGPFDVGVHPRVQSLLDTIATLLRDAQDAHSLIRRFYRMLPNEYH